MHLFPKTVLKAWGREVWLTNTELYCLKRLIVEPVRQCSLHRHAVKDETFVLHEGALLIQVGALQRILWRRGESIRIPPGVYHRFGSAAGAVLLEVSTHHDDADVERLAASGPLNLRDFAEAAP